MSTTDQAPSGLATGSQTQWLRKWQLVVGDPGATPSAAVGDVFSGAKGIDLSQFRISFHTVQSDVQTPNHAFIRIYNLSDSTAKSIDKEFTKVTLQAGYKSGAYGVVFTGDIKQVRRGRISATDTYLDILAGDGDRSYNFAVMNETLAAGADDKTKLQSIERSMDLPQGYVADLTPGALSRGKVQFGMARDYARDLAKRQDASWSIQNGKLTMIPLTSYKPGPPVVLNSTTGMIGLPEQTEGGITVRALLNPNIQIGALVQINNASIQRAFIGGNYLFAEGRLEALAKDQKLLPSVTADGFYRVYVAEFHGDTRDTPWYVDLTCLAVDRSAPADDSVKAAATND